ncbi:MAG: DUF4981 domain-containing protein [Defluviitaleaceae bacterium]|nr:DUF4981 domain-containing protein [Defluviitaleaceae bacterium]
MNEIKISPLELIEVSSIGRESARSPWKAYSNGKEALDSIGEPDPLSCNVVSLNGEWSFKYYQNPDEPDDFFEPENERAGFTKIMVPGCWELYGHGEPIYTNMHYPWDYGGGGRHLVNPNAGLGSVPNPPFSPEKNPTGCYYKSFALPDGFFGKDVFLRFDGVETAYLLYVNGRFAGYAEDSKLPSEFNVTRFVKKGENSVALKVMRWGKSAYLEDQDYWHLSGIHRDVWLTCKPAHRIEDYKITALPDKCGRGGKFSIDVFISRADGYADNCVRVSLHDKSGAQVASGESRVNAHAPYATAGQPTSNAARVSFNIENIFEWSPEEPYLYSAVITLINPNGADIDAETCRVGFKRVEIVNGILYINGQRFVARGVNRHHHQYDSGRAVAKEFMVREIIEMKRMNVNSVRTCHYPDSPLWYDLCDEYGILVVCECNLETHGVMGQLSHDPSWSHLYLERAWRMARFFKNHACVYSWSLGNESGTGANHAAMAGFLREYDPTRLCQYEAGEPGKNVSDIRGNMYAPVSKIMEMIADTEDDRPIILVEYLYQIRNSGGGLKNFVELTEKYGRFQGGYVWDWSDKCLLSKTAGGMEFFAYGGDFGEEMTDPDCPPYMTNNGVVLPDLTWKPVALELKQAYAPVVIRPAESIGPWSVKRGADRYVVINKSCAKPTNDFVITAKLRENGIPVFEQVWDAPEVAPLSQAAFSFTPKYSFDDGAEYHVEFSVSLKHGCAYADAGYETGFFQYPLAAPARPVNLCGASRPSSALRLIKDEGEITVSTVAFEFLLNRADGSIKLKKSGETVIERGGIPVTDRPYTGMDARPGWGWHGMFEASRPENQVIKVGYTDAHISSEGGFAHATAEFILESEINGKKYESRAAVRYTVGAQGEIEVDASFLINPALEFIPRAGISFALPKEFAKLAYFGMGENENYSDRLLSTKLGVFNSTVGEQAFPFIPPSETGGHEQTRWLTLENGRGGKLRVVGARPFHFDARPNSIDEYKAAAHGHELPVSREVTLNVDAAHSGIGSNMGWSTDFSAEHVVKAAEHHIRFILD